MNHDEKIAACRAIFNSCLEVLDAKGRDYSGTEDGMGNFKDFGWKGIVVRLGDKYHRLKNVSKAEAAVNESVEDTLYDTINYAALALVMKTIEDINAKEMQFIDKVSLPKGVKFERVSFLPKEIKDACDKINKVDNKEFIESLKNNS